MISRRQYFSIVLIFLAVFLMFQGTQASKSFLNPYETNAHTEDTELRSGDVFAREEAAMSSKLKSARRPYLLYIGPLDTTRGQLVREWAGYVKMDLRHAVFFPRRLPADTPAMLVVDTAEMYSAGNVEYVEELLKLGTTVVCVGHPNVEQTRTNDSLRALLGIREVRTDDVGLHGEHLFSGFFLGGERIYEAEKEKDEVRQDLELHYPWYRLGASTKVYLQGILNEEDDKTADQIGLRNEDLPAIVWRCSHAQSAVYVIPESFLEDECIGLGTLSAVAGQSTDCQLYPVVNARVVSILNFPVASDENKDVMGQVYGRNQTDLGENVILPMLISLSAKNNLRFTCCMAPQYDYEDDNLPSYRVTDLYLGRFNETGAEMALSLLRAGDTSLHDKLEADSGYFTAQVQEYSFSAVYADGDEVDVLSDELNMPLLGGVRTVLADYQSKYPVLSYLEGDVTLQQVALQEATHTYTEDLRLLGLETALGYSGSCFDMAQTMWPEGEEDQWQSLSEKVFANISTYIKPFAAFDNLTASESDVRVRRFLALDYHMLRENDRVALYIENFNDEAFFVLRTYGEEIKEVSGGSWRMIEKNAYLIRAENAYVTVTLAPAETIPYR